MESATQLFGCLDCQACSKIKQIVDLQKSTDTLADVLQKVKLVEKILIENAGKCPRLKSLIREKPKVLPYIPADVSYDTKLTRFKESSMLLGWFNVVANQMYALKWHLLKSQTDRSLDYQLAIRRSCKEMIKCENPSCENPSCENPENAIITHLRTKLLDACSQISKHKTYWRVKSRFYSEIRNLSQLPDAKNYYHSIMNVLYQHASLRRFIYIACQLGELLAVFDIHIGSQTLNSQVFIDYGWDLLSTTDVSYFDQIIYTIQLPFLYEATDIKTSMAEFDKFQNINFKI